MHSPQQRNRPLDDCMEFYDVLLPTRSEEREVLDLGVFLLQYFPLVSI